MTVSARRRSYDGRMSTLQIIGVVVGVAGLALSLLGALGAVLMSALAFGRLFFVVETKQTVTDRVVEKHSRDIDFLNGHARAEHEKLAGRVTALETTTERLATRESVENLAEKLTEGFASLRKHIDSMSRKDTRE